MKLPYEGCLFELSISIVQESLLLLFERIYKKFNRKYRSPATISRGLFRLYLKKKIGFVLGHPYKTDPYLAFAYNLLAQISNPIVVDVGACVGTTVLPIAKKIPSAKLFAIESNSNNLVHLIANQQLNQITTVINLATAVGGLAGEFVEMSHGTGNEGGHHVIHETYSLQTNGFFVPSVSLKQIFNYFKLSHCDLLKIDTEGFDYHVLESLQELADPKKVKHIVVECNPLGLEKIGKSAWDLARFGLDRGYRCSLLHNRKLITSKDDIPFIPPHYVLDFLFMNKEGTVPFLSYS